MKKAILFIIILISVIKISFAQDAQTLYNEAQQHVANNEFDDAITKFTQASNLFKANGQTANYVISEVGLVEVLINLGKLDDATAKLNIIDPEAVYTFGDSTKIVAYINTLEGRIYFMTSDLESAKKKFSKALNINIKLFGSESLEAAKNMNDIALIYANTGKIDSAIYFYNKNIEIIKNVQGENSPLLPLAYINLSNLYITQGEYEKAIDLKLKVVQISTAYKGEVCEEVGQAYSGLGNAYMVIGEYYLAEEYLKKSVEIFKQMYGKNSYRIAMNYENIGNLNNKMGNYDFALQYYFLATKILEDNFAQNANFPGLYNNIGLVCRNKGNLDNANIFFQKALDAKQKSSNIDDAETATIYTNLGTVYKQSGDSLAALNSFLKAVDILENIYGKHNPFLPEPLLNIANLYYEQGKLDSSEIYFYKSINANEKQDNVNFNAQDIPIKNYYDGIQLLESINGISGLHLHKFNTDSNTIDLTIAMDKIKICDNLITDLRKSFFNNKDKFRLNAQISKVFDNAVETAYILLYENIGNETDTKNDIFYFIERNKTSSLLQALNDAKVSKFGDVPDSLIEVEKDIKERINIYNQKLTEAVADAEKNFYRDKIIEENQNYKNILNIYKNNYPEYYNAKFNVQTIKPTDIQNIINDTTAFLNYYITSEHIFIYLITKQEIKVFSSDITDDLVPQINLMNKSLLSNKDNDIKNYIKSAKNVFDKIFYITLPSQITNLIIIPDDILGTISFESLLYDDYSGDIKTFADYPFLIKKYQISYSYSASLFYEMLKINYRNIKRNNILSLAPVFAPGNSQTYSGIPVSTIMGTKQEVDNIFQIFSNHNLQDDIFVNADANEYKLKNILGNTNYKILHIATHGHIDFQTPELSALILAHDPGNIDDGILYSGEIYNLNLKTDLVTLSACETARGVISKGEGVIGLSRAFMYAGTKNLIISLWKVSDIATTELMTDFYAELLTEYPYFAGDLQFSNSLHRAKLQMINKGYGHPYFWSSFILIGR